ncbi:Nuclear transcription factor Y subunit B-3 [Hibiscus syriacus]|uniref:Nuclear transcription factor Y subunit B-3 n=1 Tax=Hibiscus syriacus TaxID=106335 RepID=A0A6A3CQH0_HIBSY|nr:Nuclear transcription factor Y subunit B-3 [Hibiscus syriacus]
MDIGKGRDQFHRNEAISAVANESFLGEDDDDFEDLYNDVNVGEGLLQSLRRNDSVGFRNEETKNSSNINGGGKVSGSPIGAPESGVSIRGLQVPSKLNEVAVEQSGNKNCGLGSLGGMGHQGYGVGNVGGVENEDLVRQGVVGGTGVNGPGGGGCGSGPIIRNGRGNVVVAGTGPGVGANGGAGGGGGTILFVGDLHWWTTDVELESELCKYGPVKELNRNQQMAQSFLSQANRGPNDVAGKTGANNIQIGGNYQGGDNNRGYGRGNWGRGNAQGMGGRGPDGPVRNRGGRGILPSFPPVGGVGLPRMASHVNLALFRRGVPMNDMGMMPSGCVDGPNMGMWSDPSMGGWGGDEHGVGRARESIYGEEAAADHQYGEVSHGKGGWQIQLKKKIEFLKESGLVHLKEGTVMIENQDMIGTYLGRRKWAMVMIGLKEGTEMIETLAENIIVGTGTVRRSMMMIGTGGGRQGFTASPNYHRKMGIALDLEMLITGRGHGLPQGDLPEASYI